MTMTPYHRKQSCCVLAPNTLNEWRSNKSEEQNKSPTDQQQFLTLQRSPLAMLTSLLSPPPDHRGPLGCWWEPILAHHCICRFLHHFTVVYSLLPATPTNTYSSVSDLKEGCAKSQATYSRCHLLSSKHLQVQSIFAQFACIRKHEYLVIN